MASSTSTALNALTVLAQAQDGFVTAGQAREAGVDRHSLHRLLGQGFLDRDQRGLYRLVQFPASERGELWRAVLWPALQRTDDVVGVLCDGTALGLYDVSTINPRKVDIAVPRSARFRRQSSEEVRLHRRDIPAEDVTRIDGLPSTTLFRTLADLIAEGSELQFVDEALVNAPRRGLLTSKEHSSLAGMRSMDSRLLSFLRA